MCDLVFSVQEFLKIVPGLVLFPFTVYLAWKKVGVNVTASISSRHERAVASRISEVVLINLKDKPITVFGIYAVCNEKIYWEIDRYDPPIVLKSLESTRIETKPYSTLRLGAEKYNPDFLSDKIQIVLVTPHKVVKCKMVTHPDLMRIPALASYQNALKHTQQYNDIVYNEFAAYAINYVLDSKIITAIVDCSGFICCNWKFHFNAIPPEALKTEKELRKYLEAVEFEKMTKWFSVEKLP